MANIYNIAKKRDEDIATLKDISSFIPEFKAQFDKLAPGAVMIGRYYVIMDVFKRIGPHFATLYSLGFDREAVGMLVSQKAGEIGSAVCQYAKSCTPEYTFKARVLVETLGEDERGLCLRIDWKQ